MKTSIKILALIGGLLIVGYVFFGPVPSEEKNQINTKTIETPKEKSLADTEFEYNNKCLQVATQINNLITPPKEIDPLLPKSKEEQIRWLESDMDDGKVIESTLRERLDYPDTQVFIAYDPSSSDEYQAVEVRCSEWPVGGNILYMVNRTKNKVLTVEANEYISLETFADIDGDGSIEIVFQDVGGGNCWGCSKKRIMHVRGQSVQEVAMPTNYVIDDIMHRSAGLSNGFVVRATDISWENALNLPHCCGPSAHRYFQVDGTKVTDVSPLYKQEYQKLVQLDGASDNSITGSISNLLLHEAMGERDEGWRKFVADWPMVDTSEVVASDNYAEKFFGELERQYQQQVRFTPFSVGEDGDIQSRQ